MRALLTRAQFCAPRNLHVKGFDMGVARGLAPLLSAAGSTGRGTGAVASSRWLSDRGVDATTLKRWHVEVSLSITDGPAPPTFDDRVDTRFHIDIYSEEWGFFF